MKEGLKLSLNVLYNVKIWTPQIIGTFRPQWTYLVHHIVRFLTLRILKYKIPAFEYVLILQ